LARVLGEEVGREMKEVFRPEKKWEIFRKKLTNNVHHILAPLLKFTLYKSSLLYAAVVGAISHFSLVTAEKEFSIVTALVVSNSLPIIVCVTQRCDAKSTNFRNICDDALICI
jgi:hypothetical protein